MKNTAIDIPSQGYTLTIDQKNTDKQTDFYVKNKKGAISESYFDNYRKLELNLNTYNIIETFSRLVEKLKFGIHEHICRTFRNLKEVICELLLESFNNGFTFSSSKAPLKCKRESHTIQFPTLAESKQTKLWIFSCPPVLYTDLETGEERTLPYIYKISNASSYDSAILFVQKDSESKDIYPQKYVENMDFKELRPYSPVLWSFFKPRIIEISKDEIIATYLEDKQITKRKY